MRWLHVLGLLLACDIDVVGKRNGAFYHYIARFLYFLDFWEVSERKFAEKVKRSSRRTTQLRVGPTFCWQADKGPRGLALQH